MISNPNDEDRKKLEWMVAILLFVLAIVTLPLLMTYVVWDLIIADTPPWGDSPPWGKP